MAGRWFFDARPPAEWRRRLAGVGLIGLGLAGVSTAGWAYYDAWSTRQSWEASPEAAALESQQSEPTPIWVAPATPEPVGALEIVPVPKASVPTPASAAPAAPAAAVLVPTPVVTATADQLSLDVANFRFIDPPEPGVHARIAIAVTNHADVSSGRVLLGIDSAWFDKYTIIGTAPAVTSDRTDDSSGLRLFSFPPIAPGKTANYELHVTSTAEGTAAPTVKVLMDNGGSRVSSGSAEPGDVIGDQGKLTTFAPPARPGPVMSLEIPRLKLDSGVIQTEWEAPPFSVGQIKGSANVTQGNTVLIGHLTGAAGNVFAHLDQLELGDEITAVSRGLPYRFVVSQTFDGPNTDATPMQPDKDARLTLMTCAGVWNPITHDYSKRLWVVAEPPDQAEVTIANSQATATAVTAATATEVAAHPTQTPTPVPTPYAAEPSLPGGLGNTRTDLGKAFGAATGETSGKLVVFRPADAYAHLPAGQRPSPAFAAWREVRVRFSPDPQRTRLLAVTFAAPITFQAAVGESRKLFPSDTRPRATDPEGNAEFVIERFTSPTLGQAIGDTDFSVLYIKDKKGAITSVILGPGDDVDALLTEAKS